MVAKYPLLHDPLVLTRHSPNTTTLCFRDFWNHGFCSSNHCMCCSQTRLCPSFPTELNSGCQHGFGLRTWGRFFTALACALASIQHFVSMRDKCNDEKEEYPQSMSARQAKKLAALQCAGASTKVFCARCIHSGSRLHIFLHSLALCTHCGRALCERVVVLGWEGPFSGWIRSRVCLFSC